jgi:hypothetical protein
VAAQTAATADVYSTIISTDEVVKIEVNERALQDRADRTAIELNEVSFLPGLTGDALQPWLKFEELASFTILSSNSFYHVTLQDNLMVLKCGQTGDSLNAGFFKIIKEEKGKYKHKICIGAAFYSASPPTTGPFVSKTPYSVTIDFN